MLNVPETKCIYKVFLSLFIGHLKNLDSFHPQLKSSMQHDFTNSTYIFVFTVLLPLIIPFPKCTKLQWKWGGPVMRKTCPGLTRRVPEREVLERGPGRRKGVGDRKGGGRVWKKREQTGAGKRETYTRLENEKRWQPYRTHACARVLL